MNSKTKVLIITEGKKTEPKLYRKAFELFPLFNKYEIYSYKANAYDLYGYLKPYWDDGSLDDSDFLQILQEHEDDEGKKKVLDQNFSDVFLIFDFDPHDHRYDFTKLKRLLTYFNESTESGKLYINYPMVESYKHFWAMNDEAYIERKVRVEDLTSYKSIVAKESGIGNVGDFTRDTFRMIVYENLRKLNWLCVEEKFLPETNGIDDLLMCFADRQNGWITHDGYCYVLNTGLFFLPQFSSKWSE